MAGPTRELALAPEDGGERMGLGVLPSGSAPRPESARFPWCGHGCLTHIWAPSYCGGWAAASQSAF